MEEVASTFRHKPITFEEWTTEGLNFDLIVTFRRPPITGRLN
jgi:hypothetical protein